MTAWWNMLAFTMLVPGLLYWFGKSFEKDNSSEINYIIGYRTSRSMMNIDTWRFAQKFWGRLRQKTALFCAVVSLLSLLFLTGKPDDVVYLWGEIICLAQLVPLIATIPKTEKALKETFDDNGDFRRKDI